MPSNLADMQDESKILRKLRTNVLKSIDFFHGRAYNISETTNEKERYYAERILEIYDSRPNLGLDQMKAGFVANRTSRA